MYTMLPDPLSARIGVWGTRLTYYLCLTVLCTIIIFVVTPSGSDRNDIIINGCGFWLKKFAAAGTPFLKILATPLSHDTQNTSSHRSSQMTHRTHHMLPRAHHMTSHDLTLPCDASFPPSLSDSPLSSSAGTVIHHHEHHTRTHAPHAPTYTDLN